MLSSLIAAVAFQVGPFYQQKEDYAALRPFVSCEEETTDVLWPVFTAHRDWWRFCFLAYWQDFPEKESHQFTLLPLWFNGRDERGKFYGGLFPLYGRHPHVFGMYDLRFALWPLWTDYKTPRGEGWLESHSLLFPFFSWRSDGSWGAWPLCGVNRQRESVHRYALWPLATWASYREDRDTSGEGWSWMFWPLYGQVRRARESQDLFLPPFFSWTRTDKAWRLRCPWPLFEMEEGARRDRLSVFPFYEKSVLHEYGGKGDSSSATRFGWKLVEIYRDGEGAVKEWRVFPFVVSGRDYFRVWPFWETDSPEGGLEKSRFLALVPIRWVAAIDRNWSKFWTFYESESSPLFTDHSLFWGIIRWRTWK